MSKAALISVLTVALAVVVAAAAPSAQDKDSVSVPNGLGFSDFKGYEGWSVMAISDNQGKIAAILGNLVMINALKSGIPGNGKPFPDGAKIAKIHWNPAKADKEPGDPTVPGTQFNADFMLKDSKRFADSGGWGWASFDYDAAADKFSPATEADTPPQGHDAKCGFACHTLVKDHDYVFTAYAHR
jgi:Cytochrome P460